ncbi:MAG: hypothetical protein JW882_10010 [Deltaproteobacteria bacterium]|nr:hypothetical protein [Deltaproteobacteria bacterium]
MFKPNQLELFTSQSLNPTYELKRRIRLEMSKSAMSRDQVVDKMNDLASREGIQGRISKATLDGWCKDSDPSRIPSPVQLVLFCVVMDSNDPMKVLVNPLGSELIGPEDAKLLAWARAEQAKRKAVKRARIALEMIE